jgi:hypothetical protein
MIRNKRYNFLAIDATQIIPANSMDQSSIIQDASLDAPDRFARDSIKERLPINYIQILNNNDKTDALRACLIVYVLTLTAVVPPSTYPSRY